MEKMDWETPLEALYQELPPVSCTSCGKCCSSPHITFVEAFHLFSWLFESIRPREIEDFFNADSVAQSYAFNFKCRFEDAVSKLCGVHPARGFVCRVYGFPVLDRMGIDRMDNCRELDRPVIPNVRVGRMHGWLDRLGELNIAVCPSFRRPPYHVTGLNIETWLDIAVTDYARAPFSVYHRTFAALPFRNLRLNFSDRTNFSTRLSKIDAFHQARRHRGRSDYTAIRILENLLTSEPLTGTFFRYEAAQYKKRIEKTVPGSESTFVSKTIEDVHKAA